MLARAQSDASSAQQDIAFHRELVTGQPSPLARMHTLLMGEIELCIGQRRKLISCSPHGMSPARKQGILDVVTAGDAGTAARLTREHVEGTRARLLAHYDFTHP